MISHRRSPTVCVITTLDYDHVRILGNTLAEIAWQKAGIMKPGVPCVVSFDIGGEAIRVIEERAVEKQVFQRIIFE